MVSIDLTPEVVPDYTALCSTQRLHSLAAQHLKGCPLCGGHANAMFGIQGNVFLYKVVCNDCYIDIVYKEKQSVLTMETIGFAIESRNHFCRNALIKIKEYAHYTKSKPSEEPIVISEVKKIDL